MSQSPVLETYRPAFYDHQGAASSRSAQAVVPYLMEVLAPTAVLDVGCGVGSWVSAFSQAGSKTAHGIDGSWARDGGLLVPDEQFREYDFVKSSPPYRPEQLLDKYDLLTTFEFVEHVPADRAADLADFFVSKSETIVIGCAIPGQGGLNHINEQWPGYWSELMRERGYVPCDFIRPAIWDDERVQPWYRQNTIGYFRGKAPARVMDRARSEWFNRISDPLALVHPEMFVDRCSQATANAANLVRIADRMARDLGRALLRRK